MLMGFFFWNCFVIFILSWLLSLNGSLFFLLIFLNIKIWFLWIIQKKLILWNRTRFFFHLFWPDQFFLFNLVFLSVWQILATAFLKPVEFVWGFKNPRSIYKRLAFWFFAEEKSAFENLFLAWWILRNFLTALLIALVLSWKNDSAFVFLRWFDASSFE